MALDALTQKEEEVMNVLWKLGKPSISSEIVANMEEDHMWKANSFHLIIKSLINKQYVEEAGYTRSGKKIARLFAPLISLENYSSARVVAELKKYSSNGQKDTVKSIAMFLVDKPEYGDNILAELEAIMKELKANK